VERASSLSWQDNRRVNANLGKGCGHIVLEMVNTFEHVSGRKVDLPSRCKARVGSCFLLYRHEARSNAVWLVCEKEFGTDVSRYVALAEVLEAHGID